MSTITERVERGAELLDEKRPGWVDIIDLDALDLADGCACIGGQLCRSKTGAGEDYLIFIDEIALDGAGEFWHGFDGDGDDGGYGALTAAWRDLITRRRQDAEAAS